MTRDDDRKPAMPRKGEQRLGGISPEMGERLRQRSLVFQQMTSGRGKPMSYGHGKPPGQKKP